MITIITGTPGAGKTLYAISKLVLPLLGSSIERRMPDGTSETVQRKIYTNINGLQVDHELITEGDAWEKTGQDYKQVGSNSKGLHNWHEWAEPGSLIVYDEVQRAWPVRPNGSGVPPDISQLDTHRHKGVDFVLITQGVMNVDRHIHALCNRHLHVRRIANAKLAIVYEWDHCSRSLMYSKSITKSPWRYDRSVFKLYHSSDLHTKQPRSIPGMVWFVVAGFVALGFLGPTVYSRMHDRFGSSQQQVSMTSKPASVPLSPASLPQPLPVASKPLPGLPEPAPVKVSYAGCIKTPTACRCYDDKGHAVAVDQSICLDEMQRPPGTLGGAEWLKDPPRPRSDDDGGEVLAFMRERDLRGKAQQ